jgi:hypothetical protein
MSCEQDLPCEDSGGRNGAVAGQISGVPGSARTDAHLGRNIRQTTRISRKALKADLDDGPRLAGEVSYVESHDVGGDCALYMMP